MSVVTTLDVEEFSKRYSTAMYPRFELVRLNDTTPLVVSLLEQGGVPLIGVYKGERRIIGTVSNSAYNVNKILKTHGSLWYYKTKDNFREVGYIEDYLEECTWT